MPFRSHLARSFDLRLPSNLTLVLLVLGAATAALVLWLNGEPGDVLWAPAYLITVWAMVREIDPDHQWTALAAGLFAAGFALTGASLISVFAVGGLIPAARVVSGTTGRRPLIGDFLGLVVIGVGIAFTIEGWVSGFALAVALYIDLRLHRERQPGEIAAAVATATGATVVATIAGALPLTITDESAPYVIPAGLMVLILTLRDPAAPSSIVDARHGAFVDQDRVHAARTLIAVSVFTAALIAESEATIPLIVALALTAVSNEIELRRRRES